MKKLLTLAAGSTVRVTDTEGVLRGQYTMPSDGGPLAVRDLAPGRYVARDECGGERAFVVEAGEEQVVLAHRPKGGELELPGDPVPGEAGAVSVHAGGDRVVRASAGPTREHRRDIEKQLRDAA
jgi:hypothetical protein